MADKKLYEELYAASLVAATQLGGEIKNLSWFMRNWNHAGASVSAAEKEAA